MRQRLFLFWKNTRNRAELHLVFAKNSFGTTPAVSEEIKATNRENLIASLHTKNQLKMCVGFGLWQASFILSTRCLRIKCGQAHI